MIYVNVVGRPPIAATRVLLRFDADHYDQTGMKLQFPMHECCIAETIKETLNMEID